MEGGIAAEIVVVGDVHGFRVGPDEGAVERCRMIPGYDAMVKKMKMGRNKRQSVSMMSEQVTNEAEE